MLFSHHLLTAQVCTIPSLHAISVGFPAEFRMSGAAQYVAFYDWHSVSELSRVGAYGSAPFLFVTTRYSTGLPRWLSHKGVLPAVQETWV